jgi:hypothetical protein
MTNSAELNVSKSRAPARHLSEANSCGGTFAQLKSPSGACSCAGSPCRADLGENVAQFQNREARAMRASPHSRPPSSGPNRAGYHKNQACPVARGAGRANLSQGPRGRASMANGLEKAGLRAGAPRGHSIHQLWIAKTANMAATRYQPLISAFLFTVVTPRGGFHGFNHRRRAAIRPVLASVLESIQFRCRPDCPHGLDRTHE